MPSTTRVLPTTTRPCRQSLDKKERRCQHQPRTKLPKPRLPHRSLIPVPRPCFPHQPTMPAPRQWNRTLREILHKCRVMSTYKLPAFLHLDKTMIIEKRVIGTGSFGRCVYGPYCGIKVVIKQLMNLKHGTILLEKEALTMINLPSHPNLPTLLGVHRGSLSLVVQFYACGNAVITLYEGSAKASGYAVAYKSCLLPSYRPFCTWTKP